MSTDDAEAGMRESSQCLDTIYLAAAVPFLLLTLGALFYDSAGVYFAAVVLCVAQFVRPTRVGWILITGAYALVTCLFVYGFAYDVVSLARGRRPSILLGANDSVVFGTVAPGVAALTWMLAKRGRSYSPKSQAGGDPGAS
jgi:uncharacterized membrane protein